MGLDELAGPLVGCAGKSTLFMAKKCAFDQVFRNRTAIDATNGLPRRFPEPWIARHQFLADAALALDDDRMFDFAARSPSSMTRCMAGLRVMMSLKVRVPWTLRLMRVISPSSAFTFIALLIETCSRSGLTGLTKKSLAPARMALTTLSMPPWAVWTMTGVELPSSRIFSRTPMPSSSGMTRSRMMRERPFSASEAMIWRPGRRFRR